MKSITEFLNHGGPLKALRFDRGRWSCLQHDGWTGTKFSVQNALFIFCGATTKRQQADLWRGLRAAFGGGYGQYVFPVKERIAPSVFEVVQNPEPPTVKAIDTGKHWIVSNCPFCGNIHHHGRGPGHRVAHCVSRNDVHLPGYHLEIEPC